MPVSFWFDGKYRLVISGNTRPDRWICRHVLRRVLGRRLRMAYCAHDVDLFRLYSYASRRYRIAPNDSLDLRDRSEGDVCDRLGKEVYWKESRHSDGDRFVTHFFLRTPYQRFL